MWAFLCYSLIHLSTLASGVQYARKSMQTLLNHHCKVGTILLYQSGLPLSQVLMQMWPLRIVLPLLFYLSGS
jgi:hypothetical protein